MSLTFRVAVREPVAAGLKVSVTLQLANAPSVEPHVLDVTLKSFGSAPARLTLVMLTELDPAFVTVTVCAPLVFPTLMLPKFRLAGDTVITVP